MANYLHHKWKWGLKNRDKWINSIMKNYSGQIMHVKWLVQYLSTPTSLITRNQGNKEEGNVEIFVQGTFDSDQIRSVAQSCPTLYNPMNCSTPRLLVHHQLQEFTQTQVLKSVMPQAISSYVIPVSSCPQSLPASESFPMSQLFAQGGQSTGVSALTSFLPKNTQGWAPLEWTGIKWEHFCNSYCY